MAAPRPPVAPARAGCLRCTLRSAPWFCRSLRRLEPSLASRGSWYARPASAWPVGHIFAATRTRAADNQFLIITDLHRPLALMARPDQAADIRTCGFQRRAFLGHSTQVSHWPNTRWDDRLIISSLKRILKFNLDSKKLHAEWEYDRQSEPGGLKLVPVNATTRPTVQ